MVQALGFLQFTKNVKYLETEHNFVWDFLYLLYYFFSNRTYYINKITSDFLFRTKNIHDTRLLSIKGRNCNQTLLVNQDMAKKTTFYKKEVRRDN